LKTKPIYIVFGILVASCLLSFNDPYLKKRITDKEFRYEFYTTVAKTRPRNNVIYYWFKAGSIHFTQEGISGELLHDDFDKFYLNNQLAEKGRFKKGKKVGTWRSWFENGMLSSEEQWSSGYKNGLHFGYNSQGQLVEKGLYRSNKKQGKWINFLTKDTIRYNNDVAVLDKSIAKNKFLKNKLSNDSIIKNSGKTALKENPNSNTKPKKQNKVAKQPEVKNRTTTSEQSKPKKDSFFKRLFSKKEKTKTTNGKGS
jgi:antitoxin component YwqK of YwqJK toxin-antitoxin module